MTILYRTLHRNKAIESYKGATLMIEQGLVYPSYVMLKESLRATLVYILEDITEKEFSEKTKLKTLLDLTPAVLTPGTDLEMFNIFIELEEQGLSSIMNVDIDELNKIRKTLKQIIGVYLHERL